MSVLKQTRPGRLAAFAVPLVALVAAVMVLGSMHGLAPSADAANHGALGLSAGGGAACEGGACSVATGGEFTLTVAVTTAPDGYIGVGTQIDYDGLIYNPTTAPTDEVVLGDCNFPNGISVRAPGQGGEPPTGTEGVVSHGMTAGTPPFTPCNVTGPAVQIALSCPSDGEFTVNLVPYSMPDNTLGSGFKVGTETVAANADSLTVNCGEGGGQAEATATPDGGAPTGGPTGPTQPSGLPTTGSGDAIGINGNGDGNNAWIIVGALAGAAFVAALALFGWRRFAGAR